LTIWVTVSFSELLTYEVYFIHVDDIFNDTNGNLEATFWDVCLLWHCTLKLWENIIFKSLTLGGPYPPGICHNSCGL